MDYTKSPFCLSEADLAWVEQTFASMSQEEKLNQVFMDMLWNEPPKKVEAHQKARQLGGFRYNNMAPGRSCAWSRWTGPCPQARNLSSPPALTRRLWHIV